MISAAGSRSKRLLSASIFQRHFRHCAAENCRQGRAFILPSLGGMGLEMQSRWYCSRQCLEFAISAAFRRASYCRAIADVAPPRSLPLGLLLHSRGDIDEDSLLHAVKRARVTGLPIGQILLQEKRATERQITSALAAQCGCSAYFGTVDETAVNRVPSFLQRTFGALPLQFVSARNLLYVGFRNRPNYSLLVAIETILQCRPEPAIVPEALFARTFEPRCGEGTEEICFPTHMPIEEVAQLCAEYACRRGAQSLRLSPCGDRFWARVKFTSQSLDLFFPLWANSEAKEISQQSRC